GLPPAGTVPTRAHVAHPLTRQVIAVHSAQPVVLQAAAKRANVHQVLLAIALTGVGLAHYHCGLFAKLGWLRLNLFPVGVGVGVGVAAAALSAPHRHLSYNIVAALHPHLL